jgi:hypothetical protein
MMEASMVFTKGASPKSAEYAKGGPVMGSRSRFMKTPDNFRCEDSGEPKEEHGFTQRSDYGKHSPGGELSKTEGDSKSEKPVKPKG